MSNNSDPASESSSQEKRLARWYEFFLDVCRTAARMDYGIAVHPKHKAALQDMMERAAEDPLWPTGWVLPPLVVATQVPEGEYRFIDKATMRTISFAAALQSSKGLGRFKKAYTPQEALRRN